MRSAANRGEEGMRLSKRMTMLKSASEILDFLEAYSPRSPLMANFPSAGKPRFILGYSMVRRLSKVLIRALPEISNPNDGRACPDDER